MSRKTQIDHCTTTSSMSAGVPLSTGTIGLLGQAWPSLANAHFAVFTYLFIQDYTRQTRTSVSDPSYPTWLYSSAHPMVW
jgi:hypothetical protein